MKKSMNKKVLYTSAFHSTWSNYLHMHFRVEYTHYKNNIFLTAILLIVADLLLISHISIGFLLLIIGICMPCISYIKWRKHTNEMYEQSDLKDKNITYSFYRDHFEIEGSSLKINYKDLTECMETKKYFYLIFNNIIYAIPKKKGLRSFLRKFKQEETNPLIEKTCFFLIFTAVVLLTFYACINAFLPTGEILRYWVRNVYCLSLMLFGMGMIFVTILVIQSRHIKSFSKGKKILIRILLVLLCILIELVLGFLFLFDLLNRETIQANKDGTYTCTVSPSESNQNNVLEKDGPFYLKSLK